MAFSPLARLRLSNALKSALGGVCQWCGARSQLEFDCDVPQGDRHHKLSSTSRAVFYRRQLALGNLQLLCQACHTSKRDQDWIMDHLLDT